MLEIKSICKYTLNNFSLSVNRGEILSLLGSSGSGKTTLLRIIAGFEEPTDGEIYIDSKVVVSKNRFIKPEERRVGFVFQDYALFPHLNIAQNIAFGLFDLDSKSKSKRVDEMLELVNLKDVKDRYIHEISGGQQQRVALARALATKPEVILLDEPFSNLDEELKSSLRIQMRDILKHIGITTILVTHDKYDSLSIADRLALLRDGKIEQIGTPQELYEKPISRYCANFFGKTNILSSKELNTFTNLNLKENQNYMIRPHKIKIIQDSKEKNLIVKEILYFGEYIELKTVVIDSNIELSIKSVDYLDIKIDDKIAIEINRDSLFII